MKFSIGFLLIISLGFLVHVSAQNQDRPKIGLVLSGGGSKGIAHIGAIQVLEEHGIRPDYVLGTSIGSIVGGLYALGYSPEQLETLVLKLNWEDYFSDEIPRFYRPIADRDYEDNFLISLPVEEGKIKLPTGLISGKKIELLFSSLTLGSSKYPNYDKLPIPYRAICTNFETGTAVVLDSGNLSQSMRASMSIPSVFQPVNSDSLLLIDGGLANNLPVQYAIDLGADITIAVDVSAPLIKSSDITNIFDILDQTSSYTMVNNINTELKKADVVISPNIKGISALDFHQTDTLLQRGRKAAHKQIDVLKHKLGRPLDNPVVTNPLIPYVPDSIQLNELIITPSTHDQYNSVRNTLQLATGQTYSLEHIQARMMSLISSSKILSAHYEIIPKEDPNSYALLVFPSYNPSKHQTNLNGSINYDNNLKAALLFNLTTHDIFLKQSKFALDFRISEFPSLKTTYQVNTTAISPSFGVQLEGRIQYLPGKLYQQSNLITTFDIHQYAVNLNLLSASQNWLFKTNLNYTYNSYADFFFDTGQDQLNTSNFAVGFSIKKDNYNKLYFPTKGGRILFQSHLGFGGKILRITPEKRKLLNNRRFTLSLSQIVSLSQKWNLELHGNFGSQKWQDKSIFSHFFLGRAIHDQAYYFDVTGMAFMQGIADHFAQSGFKLCYQAIPKLYLNLLADYAFREANSFLYFRNDTTTLLDPEQQHIVGAGIQLAYDSRIGPHFISIEHDFISQKTNFWLHLGYFF